MLECWQGDVRYRKQAQALSRDVNQLMRHVCTFRKKHDMDAGICSLRQVWHRYWRFFCLETWQQVWDEFNAAGRKCEIRQLSESMQDVSQYNFFASALSATTSLRQIVNVFQLDRVDVILKERVGQGFYGDVFKGLCGWLDGLFCVINTVDNFKGVVNGNGDCVTVAVKKLNVFDGNFRELNAMKVKDYQRAWLSLTNEFFWQNLKHPNIVRILAVQRQTDVQLVMEYASHGSLQCYLRINRDNLGPKKLLKYATDVANVRSLALVEIKVLLIFF